MFKKTIFVFLICTTIGNAQDYYLKNYEPFDEKIPSPSEFLGYDIGEQHTRHDLIVAYFKELARLSDKAGIEEYGKTYEGRSLIMLAVSKKDHLDDIGSIQQRHIDHINPAKEIADVSDLPVVVNLGYGVHGNEPSSAEAALLTAYTLIASKSQYISDLLDDAVVFIDPVINPDGRDRHTHWANMYRGNPLVSDPQDAEHSEYWPGGRTNHYWFDLNRDWLLGVHPESRGKLNWIHSWYPNVVTDFHEMGTSSTYFFEPMKMNASADPIMPRENYIDLNDMFASFYHEALDSIGSLYFTKEVFDGTYPGYGSSYPDLQGGLALLFEQASSRGHVQETLHGKVTFPFTIRNQYISSMATLRAAVAHKNYLRTYQRSFFESAHTNAEASKISGYEFHDVNDRNRTRAFIDKLLLHRIEVYKGAHGKFVVPVKQDQYRMVQTVFETYDNYRDSVYYDASAWSLANFYNMKYKPVSGRLNLGDRVESTKFLESVREVKEASYAYVIDGSDYNVPAFMYALLKKEVNLSVAFKPFSINTIEGPKSFGFGSVVIPVSKQKISKDKLFELIAKKANGLNIEVHSLQSGYSSAGIDIGSGNIRPVRKPKAVMLIGNGVRSYEAGEVWHLLDTRVHMPITKIPMRNFNRAQFDQYNVMVLVSGSYGLSKDQEEKIKSWVAKGNTLITIGSATKMIVDKKWVKEQLVKDSAIAKKPVERLPYVTASEELGKEQVGGAIFRADLDITHPLAFGYSDASIPVYKNNSVWLAPSKSKFSTVAKYSANPHIDGFITKKNLDTYMSKSASLIVSQMGRGKVIMFADNPNFRGSWYGTNRLFLNGLFLGHLISVR